VLSGGNRSEGTALAEITVGSSLGNALTELLEAEDIVPGEQPSYALCKSIFLAHPLGAKLAELPIIMAQCQKREISIPDSPEDDVRERFVQQWEEDGFDEVIFNVKSLSRVYGIASVALVSEKLPPSEPLDFDKIADLPIAFSVFDPLNTAGSLVLNQNPNAIDFMKVTTIAVSGQIYHRSRAVTVMNERPIYIAYTTSAFGFVGRSVYQRILFPLKSFVQSMITDDLVTKKAGVFIFKLSVAGAIINNIMQGMAALKRWFLKVSTNGNVISIGTEEEVETLNMQNIDKAMTTARQNVLENIASGAAMPAILLKEETFAEGFGEGTEDAKQVARWVDRMRVEMLPLYVYFNKICMHRAWNRQFYEIIQKKYPAWADVTYEEAFYRWSVSFKAIWPNLLTEPDSEKVKSADVKLKAIIATIEVLMPALDPENKAIIIQWLQDNINDDKYMFQNPLSFDFDKLREYVPPQPLEEPKEPRPFAAQDSADRHRRALDRYSDAAAELVEMLEKRERPRLAPPKPGNGSRSRVPS
jgi:hypothetical protein